MLKPQDIPILLKTHLWQDRRRYSDLAESLGMSASEVHSSLKRSTIAKLYNPLTHQPLTPHLLELLIHGLKYIYPATPGTLVRGMPTAHGISPLKEQIISSQEPLVWAFPTGTEIGLALTPLYPSVPCRQPRSPTIRVTRAGRCPQSRADSRTTISGYRPARTIGGDGCKNFYNIKTAHSK